MEVHTLPDCGGLSPAYAYAVHIISRILNEKRNLTAPLLSVL